MAFANFTSPNRIIASALFLLVALSMTVACPPARAADFAQDEIDQRLSRKGSTVKRIVKGRLSDHGDKETFETFFDDYYFPALTQATAEGLGELGDLRYELFRSYIVPATREIQQELTKKAYAYISKVIRGKYHPSVKYNAVLVLGSLGSSYTQEGTTPLPAANGLLGKMVELGLSEKLPPYMLAGAVVGLHQHAQAFDKLPASNQEATVKALVKVASQTEFDDDTSRLTKDWIRWRAATGLAEIASKGANAEAATALVKLISDETLKLDARCEVASLLPSGNLPDGPGAAMAVLELTRAVTKDEAKEATDFQENFVGGRQSSQSARLVKSDRMRYDQEMQRIVYIRAGLLARMEDLKKGLIAVSGGAGDNAAAVQAVGAAITKLTELVTSRDAVTDLAIADAVIDLSASVKSATSGLGGAAAEQEPEVEADLFE